MFADLISGVIIPGVGLKQVVPRGQLEGHAGGGPDVRRGVVAGPQEDLQGPVLPGLDVLGLVVGHPAGVTQVGYLALQVRHQLTDRILHSQFIKPGQVTPMMKALLSIWKRELLQKKCFPEI